MARTKWAAEEIVTLRRLAPKMSALQIGKRMGRSEASVEHKMVALHLHVKGRFATVINPPLLAPAAQKRAERMMELSARISWCRKFLAQTNMAA